jgi:membrane associated rhomboid family serine protease
MDDESAGKGLLENEWQAIQSWRVAPEMVQGFNRQKARLWSLVLDSREVPCCLEQHPAGLQLLVPPEHLDRAYKELCSFEEQNRGWPAPLPPPRPLIENTLATISILILLATFHNITGLDIMVVDGFPIDWLRLGSANAAKILDGEWWRLVTALTLHSDVVHLLSNLAIGGIFVFLLCRELGSGLAWTLLLAAGSIGNLFNAVMQSGTHNSVGASTAVFGAVGLLAALSLVRYRHHLQRRWPLPVAAALTLLVLLGTEGKNTDIGAHLFGFLTGIALGLVTESVIARYGLPGRSMNALLAMLSGVIVVTCWLVAVAAG